MPAVNSRQQAVRWSCPNDPAGAKKEGNLYSCVSVCHNACWCVNSAPPAQTDATAGTAGDVMMERGVELLFLGSVVITISRLVSTFG